MRADHAAAMDWLRQAKERGKDVSTITLEEPPPLASTLSDPLAARHAQSRDFGVSAWLYT